MSDQKSPGGATPLLPSLAIVFASLLWGFYWIPIRALEEAGMAAAWPSLILNGAVAVVLLPGAFFLYRRFLKAPKDIILSGLAIGGALAFYGISLNLTDVVRAVLLFYLSPAWSTVIGIIWLGERLTLRRICALALGFAGLLVVLKGDGGLPLPQNIGDWIALISGVLWSFGSARLFVGKADGAYEVVIAVAIGTVLTTGAMLLIFPADVMGAVPEMSVFSEAIPVLAIGVFALMIPILFLTVWGARRLPPATVGILLLGEIVVALASAAILLPEEAFGTRELIGAILITGAGVVEVLPRRRKAKLMEESP